MNQQAAAVTQPTPITTAEEAASAIDRLNTSMDRLETTVAEETTRVRSGRLRDAIALVIEKADLARDYTTESERVRAAKAVCSAASSRSRRMPRGATRDARPSRSRGTGRSWRHTRRSPMSWASSPRSSPWRGCCTSRR